MMKASVVIDRKTGIPPTEQAPVKMLLRLKEAADLLSLSPRKLWELSACGEIKRLKIGASVRYAVTDLQDWIECQRARGGN